VAIARKGIVVFVCLPSKHEALNSNTSTTKKKKKEKDRKGIWVEFSKAP
jgi:hypothetical protein